MFDYCLSKEAFLYQQGGQTLELASGEGVNAPNLSVFQRHLENALKNMLSFWSALNWLGC